MCWNTYFYNVFWSSTKIYPQNGQKKRQLLTFCKTQVDIKKPFCCNPPFHQKYVFFQVVCFETKTFMLNKKHNLKWGQNKDKEKGFERKNKTGNHKKREKIDETKKLQFNIFMLFFSWSKSKEERKMKKVTKTRNKKKSKRKTRRKKETQKQERDRERETEKGGRPKKVKGERKRNTENKQKNALLGGKQGFSIKTKERKKKNKKTNKEGLGPSEVALWVQKNKIKNKSKKTKQKQIRRV